MIEPTLLPLMAWLSPTFPVGAYAYSHGLEWAVEAGSVADEASLTEWLGDVVLRGAGRNDAILLSAAHAAACTRDAEALLAANALALALAPSRELHLETSQGGRSFLDALGAAWPQPALAALAPLLDEVAYPVAVGLGAGAHGLVLKPTLEAYLLAFAQNLVSAALRLAPVGQTAGARVLARLVPEIPPLAAAVCGMTLDDIGSSTFRLDLGSARHETQYTRLFRS